MLREYLRGLRGKRFRYGRHDCIQMAGRWVEMRTGRDMLADWRYSSLAQARAALKARGLADHVAAAAEVLPEIPVLQARVGDVAAINGVLGIVTGEMVAVPDKQGYAQLPLTMASRAFRVE